MGVHSSVSAYLKGLKPIGAKNGEKRWQDEDGEFIYTWDSLHGEIEWFNKRGKHLGALDAQTGEFIKDPEKTRTIDV